MSTTSLEGLEEEINNLKVLMSTLLASVDLVNDNLTQLNNKFDSEMNKVENRISNVIMLMKDRMDQLDATTKVLSTALAAGISTSIKKDPLFDNIKGLDTSKDTGAEIKAACSNLDGDWEQEPDIKGGGTITVTIHKYIPPEGEVYYKLEGL